MKLRLSLTVLTDDGQQGYFTSLGAMDGVPLVGDVVSTVLGLALVERRMWVFDFQMLDLKLRVSSEDRASQLARPWTEWADEHAAEGGWQRHGEWNRPG